MKLSLTQQIDAMISELRTLKPRSHRRIALQRKLIEARTKQLRAEYRAMKNQRAA